MNFFLLFMFPLFLGGHCAKRMNGFHVFLTSDGLTEGVEPVFISKQLDPGPIIKISFDIAKVGR